MGFVRTATGAVLRFSEWSVLGGTLTKVTGKKNFYCMSFRFEALRIKLCFFTLDCRGIEARVSLMLVMLPQSQIFIS